MPESVRFRNISAETGTNSGDDASEISGIFQKKGVDAEINTEDGATSEEYIPDEIISGSDSEIEHLTNRPSRRKYGEARLRKSSTLDMDKSFEDGRSVGGDPRVIPEKRPMRVSSEFMDTISSIDLLEMGYTIHEIVGDFVNEPSIVIEMSNPKFHTMLIDEVVNTLFDQWLDADLCDEEDYDDVYDFIENEIDSYFEMGNYYMPPVRSRKTTMITDRVQPSHDIIAKKIADLEAAPQPAQRTPEWYEFRHNLITASNLSKVFGSDALLNSLIFEKCKPYEIRSENGYVNTDSPMHWGQKYEPISRMIYEDLYGARVSDTFGCIQHPKVSCIGASPDGIVVDPQCERYGRMLEIKNIVNREMDGIPSKAYWIQMQIQMETCDLDECDFMETRIVEYKEESEFWGDLDTNDDGNINPQPDYKGVIMYFVERTSIGDARQISGAPHYEYMPFSIPLTKDAVHEWMQSTRQRLRRNWSLYTTLYWYLADYSCVLVERNRQWFCAACPKIQAIWKIIERERKHGYEHRAAKKRATKIDAKIDAKIDMVKVVRDGADNTTTHIICNLPLQASVCLIKLDSSEK